MNAIPAAPGVSYFTPAQDPPAGQHRGPGPVLPLFQPLTVRGATFPNRIGLSPMVQLSSDDGIATSWHVAHIGGILTRGPGFAVMEATAVTKDGRSAVTDLGLYEDKHIEPLQKVTEFARSQNKKIFIQLYHGGRKSSLMPVWSGTGRHTTATKEQGGWPDRLVAPSAIRYDETSPTPRALTTAEVKEHVQAWKDAAVRAVKAGFDGVEIHAAHGYLIHQFLSGVTNKRTDEYGGSFENRTRFLLEIVEAVRSVLPETSPLLVRLSATDGLETHPELAAESWTVPQSAKLAPLLAERGADMLDVSSYSLHPEQKFIHTGDAYQAPFAKEIKKAVGNKLIVGTVGEINSGKLANAQIEEGLDFVSVGRPFLKNPGVVIEWAEELKTDVILSRQYGWPFGQVDWK